MALFYSSITCVILRVFQKYSVSLDGKKGFARFYLSQGTSYFLKILENNSRLNLETGRIVLVHVHAANNQDNRKR